ncbi:unnamed protein product [Angiostrongylus costaricensis]|uniref:Uncharacterized protein n=1 Tax=Angiostrongylus costaricensis TaxID=334426 RepID=A0A0R3PU21_ANGCS|nr:unnamed protein product [Angiostrongylus costaricensis]
MENDGVGRRGRIGDGAGRHGRALPGKVSNAGRRASGRLMVLDDAAALFRAKVQMNSEDELCIRDSLVLLTSLVFTSLIHRRSRIASRYILEVVQRHFQ